MGSLKKPLAYLVPFLLVLAMWLLWEPIVIHWWPSRYHNDLQSRGQFGDSYGGINALFAGWAFAGVAVTIYLQVLDRRVQERERAERERVRLIDRFDDRFFRLCDVLRSHVHSIELNNQKGKRGLATLIKVQEMMKTPEVDHMAGAVARYESMYFNFKNILGPYFRLLYRIIKYIDESSIDDKETYTGIVRAELGNAELWLLALNCLTKNGEKFKPLVIKYHLLKHLDSRGGIWRGVEENLRLAYPAQAFTD